MHPAPAPNLPAPCVITPRHGFRQAWAHWISVWLVLSTLPVLGGRPNVLILLADDLGIGDVSAYRKADVRTPHIDRLAREGIRFTALRANATVCSPTRAALLTGRYPDRVGVPGVIRTQPEDSWGWLNPQVPTLPEMLKPAGYHTALIGKWHLGLTSPNTPNERGFEFFHGFLGDMMDSYTDHRRHGYNYLRRNQEPISPNGHATDLFPTVLELAGQPLPANLDAVSVLPLLRGQAAPAGLRELYFVRREGGYRYGGNSYEALIQGRWKVLRNDPYSPLELYDLTLDPGETNNLAAPEAKILQELSTALRRHVQRGGVMPWQPPDHVSAATPPAGPSAVPDRP